MSRTGSKPPTLADLDALPPGVVGEIIEGVLYTMTWPRAPHQFTAGAIAADLRAPFGLGRGGPGGWWIIAKPGLELPNDTKEISPDVAGWHRERMPELPVDEPIRIVPDWVCEVLSPTTRHHDQTTKVPYLAKVGVPFLWLADIEARTLTALGLDAGYWRALATYGEETDVRIAPFDAVPLDVASWWTRS